MYKINNQNQKKASSIGYSKKLFGLCEIVSFGIHEDDITSFLNSNGSNLRSNDYILTKEKNDFIKIEEWGIERVIIKNEDLLSLYKKGNIKYNWETNDDPNIPSHFTFSESVLPILLKYSYPKNKVSEAVEKAIHQPENSK